MVKKPPTSSTPKPGTNKPDIPSVVPQEPIPPDDGTPQQGRKPCFELPDINIKSALTPLGPSDLGIMQTMKEAASLTLPRSPYSCVEDIKDIKSSEDLYDFFFHKFPWYEFLSRSMISLRNAIANSSMSSSFDGIMQESLQCIIDADITRLYCTFLNIRDLYDNCNEYVKASVNYTILTIPKFQYINIFDIFIDIRRQFYLYIENFIIEFVENIISVALKDLLNTCKMDSYFCSAGFKDNGKIVETSKEISNKYYLYNKKDNNGYISFDNIGDTKFSVSSISIIDLLNNVNKKLIIKTISF
jgi:hypothetical protein